ncbi:MAG: metallophosphoesterase family protein [Ardenticatenaceae bacterium]|nr:metallophosphoesterase family protein [Anaerolineales bacterium]MCB8921193.1 metallophosphoesterase family protein [Ardenticatenaceae bacterium]MCB9004265.1 metallophosphoesterase family protein [Ardenticatenaceae bacterium]
MRVALISDIHGNLVSFEAVLADIHKEHVDRIVFLGDAATLGPQPREVLTRLQALKCDCIMGNHDAFLVEPALLSSYTDEPWVTVTTAWCRNQLKPEDFDFLRTFQPHLEIIMDPEQPQASKLFCFHGSPRSNVDIIVATTPNKKLKKMLRGVKTAVMVGGHTHVQMLRQHKGRLLLNAGSVGMPFKQTPFKGPPRILPWAEYTIVTWLDGVLSVDLRRVPVPLGAVRAAACASDMPDREEWINNWQVPHELW